VLLKYEDKLSRFTWNIMAVRTALLPAPGVEITETKPAKKTSAVAEKANVVRGLRQASNEAEPGYVLYAPLLSDTTYLIDAKGAVVHTWKSDYSPSGTVYLLDNGNLLRGAREPIDGARAWASYPPKVERSRHGDRAWRQGFGCWMMNGNPRQHPVNTSAGVLSGNSNDVPPTSRAGERPGETPFISCS
jgi:hypothetical protein